MYVVTFDMGTNKTYNMDWTVTAKQLMTPNMPFKQRLSYTLGLAQRPSTSECGIDCETESERVIFWDMMLDLPSSMIWDGYWNNGGRPRAKIILYNT